MPLSKAKNHYGTSRVANYCVLNKLDNLIISPKEVTEMYNLAKWQDRLGKGVMATIKKITKLKNLGIYDDFSWAGDLPELKQYNLVTAR